MGVAVSPVSNQHHQHILYGSHTGTNRRHKRRGLTMYGTLVGCNR